MSKGLASGRIRSFRGVRTFAGTFSDSLSPRAVTKSPSATFCSVERESQGRGAPPYPGRDGGPAALKNRRAAGVFQGVGTAREEARRIAGRQGSATRPVLVPRGASSRDPTASETPPSVAPGETATNNVPPDGLSVTRMTEPIATRGAVLRSGTGDVPFFEASPINCRQTCGQVPEILQRSPRSA